MKVYVASPYSNGRQASNVKRQLDAMHILMDNGFTPFIPLLNHFAEVHNHRPESEWFSWDLEWLKMCDALIRIVPIDDNGVTIPSPGADEEEALAISLGIPAYRVKDLQELSDWCGVNCIQSKGV